MNRGIDFGPVRGTNDAGYPFDFDVDKVDDAIERLRKVATGEFRPDYANGIKGIYLHTDLAMVLDWERSIRRDRDNSMRMSKAQNTVIAGVFDVEALMARLGELVKKKCPCVCVDEPCAACMHARGEMPAEVIGQAQHCAFCREAVPTA